MSKTRSTEFKSDTQESSKKGRSMSIAEITLKKSVSQKLRKKMMKAQDKLEKDNTNENPDETPSHSEKSKDGKIEVIIKPKKSFKQIVQETAQPTEV